MKSLGVLLCCGLVGIASEVHAQNDDFAAPDYRLFLEGTGSWGFEIGNQPYLPDGEGGFKHPVTNGPGAIATAGVSVFRNLDVFLSYQFAHASSREGQIPNLIDRIEGQISFHTLILGVRIYRDFGPGRLFGDLGGGLLFPFSTRLEVDYADAAANLPQPISGSGSRVSNYDPGYGFRGYLGYSLPVIGPLYAIGMFGVRAFQSDNNNETTVLTNFIPDTTAEVPTTVTTTIENGEGVNQPTTYSVQDFRLHVGLGVRY